MCGINGMTWSDPDLVRRMNEATRHRGPDGTGVFSDAHVALGQNLLAITDVPANCNQPVVSERFVLLYNGEIYNYRTLRDELQEAGDHFTTDADTEVLFAGLTRHGRDFLNRLDGMFAIAWYDRKQETLLLTRDSAGIKPLYWSMQPEGLVFSSELRGLFAAGVPKTLNRDAEALYMALGYVPGPSTLIADIRKLCPGRCLEYRLRGKSIKTGWTGSSRTPLGLDADIAGQIRSTIGASARGQTMGLRPFGLYVSGGLDSSILLHELAHGSKKFKTYTTRFDVGGEFNEDADIAQRLCADYGVDHQELLIRGDEYADAYVAAIEAIEEPRWNPSIGAYWLLAQEAAKDIVVVLNGSGGDELFFGYPRYQQSRLISERYARYPRPLVDFWYTAAAAWKRRIPFGRMMHLASPLERWAYLNRINDGNALATIVDALNDVGYPAVRYPVSDVENAVAQLDRLFWLADEEYIRTDKISMHFGMEGRFPLMGHQVVQLADTIPSAMKLRRGTTKSLLRDAYRGHLPGYVTEKRKTGWKAPVGHWMTGAFGDLVRDTAPGVVPTGVLNTRAMKSFLPAVALRIWAKNLTITL